MAHQKRTSICLSIVFRPHIKTEEARLKKKRYIAISPKPNEIFLFKFSGLFRLIIYFQMTKELMSKSYTFQKLHFPDQASGQILFCKTFDPRGFSAPVPGLYTCK